MDLTFIIYRAHNIGDFQHGLYSHGKYVNI